MQDLTLYFMNMTYHFFISALFLILVGCDLFLGGSYEVKRLEEYVDYVAGRDLYREKGVGVLKFACDNLRDQMVEVLDHNMLNDPDLKLSPEVRKELRRLKLFGARREGKVLHLMNDVTVGEEGLEAWRAQVAQLLANDPADKRRDWLPAVMRRLFDSVVLHAGDRQVVIRIDYRHKCN